MFWSLGRGLFGPSRRARARPACQTDTCGIKRGFGSCFQKGSELRQKCGIAEGSKVKSPHPGSQNFLFFPVSRSGLAGSSATPSLDFESCWSQAAWFRHKKCIYIYRYNATGLPMRKHDYEQREILFWRFLFKKTSIWQASSAQSKQVSVIKFGWYWSMAFSIGSQALLFPTFLCQSPASQAFSCW